MDEQEPEVLELLRELAGDFQKRFATYFLGGLGIGLVTLPLTFVAVFLLYGGMFGGMVPGIMMEDEDIMLGGMVGGMLLGLLAMVAMLVVVLAPLQASLARAMVAHFDGEEDLSLGAPFSTATEGLPNLLTFTVVHTVVGFVLTLFCYLPGIVWYALTDFAWCRVVLDGESAVEALGNAIAHVREHPVWHLTYFVILVAAALIVSYIPLIGTFLAPSVTIGWRVYAYRRSVHRIQPLGA